MQAIAMTTIIAMIRIITGITTISVIVPLVRDEVDEEQSPLQISFEKKKMLDKQGDRVESNTIKPLVYAGCCMHANG